MITVAISNSIVTPRSPRDSTQVIGSGRIQRRMERYSENEQQMRSGARSDDERILSLESARYELICQSNKSRNKLIYKTELPRGELNKFHFGQATKVFRFFYLGKIFGGCLWELGRNPNWFEMLIK